MKIQKSPVYFLAAVIPWLCTCLALPRRPPGNGLFIPELGLMYNDGVLTDPVTGVVSQTNPKIQNTKWGYYKPAWNNIPRFPRGREVLRPRKVNTNVLSRKPLITPPAINLDLFSVNRPLIKQPQQLPPATTETIFTRFVQNQVKPFGQTQPGIFGGNQAGGLNNKPFNHINQFGSNKNTGNFYLNPVNAQRNRVNVNIDPITKLVNVPNSNILKANSNDFSRIPGNPGFITFNKPSNLGIRKTNKIFEPLNTHSVFGLQNTGNIGAQRITPNKPLLNLQKIPAGNQPKTHLGQSIFRPTNAQIFGQKLPTHLSPNNMRMNIGRSHSAVQRLPVPPPAQIMPVQMAYVPASNIHLRYPQYVYGPHIYGAPPVWDPRGFRRPPTMFRTLRPTPAPTTTTPPPPPTPPPSEYWNAYDWNWADPFGLPMPTPPQQRTLVTLIRTPPAQVHNATVATPLNNSTAIPPVPNAFIHTAKTKPKPPSPVKPTLIPKNVSSTPIVLNLTRTSPSPTPIVPTGPTTMSPKNRAHYLKSILKPPFQQKYYEQICLHYNRTYANRTSHAFGPIHQDCGSYVKCNVFNGFFFPNETSCGFGLWFDTGAGICTDADAIGKPCLYNPCSQLVGGQQANIPYPGTCGGFLACEGGSATAEMCDAGINFDAATGMCCVAPAFCPCFSDMSGTASPDYQLQTFLQQFHDTAPLNERPANTVHEPLSLRLQQSGLCVPETCSLGSAWDPVTCLCSPW